ncbi:AraC family transcriptional regulator [Falsiruegeria mediterranea]|uniref:AraC family transcriptional regulator n=1 Tax=Falsiruegeria mediterranea TaxID=1280832 RepID=UPI000D552CF7|nr:AraC family transcriptional regulator [Falsiruegeria mediterranea]
MSRPSRYPFSRFAQKLCAHLNVPQEVALKHAGLPANFLGNSSSGFSAGQLFAMWEGIISQAPDSDLLQMARDSARGPFNPAILSFSCSPNTEVGLQRLGLFKPLVAPVCISAKREDGVLRVSISSVDPGISFPSSFATFELAYFLELTRVHSAWPVVPLRAGLPSVPEKRGRLQDFVGVHIEKTDQVTFDLSLEDAHRSLITENEDLWPSFEKGLRAQMFDRTNQMSFSARVRMALMDLLPSGQSNASAISRELNVSKRSLYRYLAHEGQSFQGILDGIRTELSLEYLQDDELSVDEISYLLAFSDPNSFYRAFKGWTGLTPLQARARQRPDQIGTI